MDNQTHNADNEWVEDKVASLVPPADWHPDSKRALAQFLNRRERRQTEASPQWIRLSMAAAILASIGLVVTLLPWQSLWKLGAEDKSRQISGPVKAETPAVPPSPQQEHKLVAKRGSDVNPYGIIVPATESNYTDEVRREHILGTVASVQQTAPPAPDQVQKPVEHVGPGVTPPRAIPPMADPDYTDVARQAHIQGTVVLSVIILADGTGKFERVDQSLDPGLDQKAVEAFEKWRFTPAMKDGKPVDVELQVTFNFHLY